MRESVLLATLGPAPQVVTLTRDSLNRAGAEIQRVEVFHTDPRREPIRTALPNLQNAIHALPDPIIFVPHVLTGDQGPLVDVTDASAFESAFRLFYQVLRQHKQAGRVVHLSVATGRKTLALAAMSAAQIVLESDDRIWHLISDAALRESGCFHADDPQAVQLIQIPVLNRASLPDADRSRAQAFMLHTLTAAERDVAALLIREGLSNAELAARLGKSEKTIANQLNSVYRKLADDFHLSSAPDRTTLLALLGKFT